MANLVNLVKSSYNQEKHLKIDDLLSTLGRTSELLVSDFEISKYVYTTELDHTLVGLSKSWEEQ